MNNNFLSSIGRVSLIAAMLTGLGGCVGGVGETSSSDASSEEHSTSALSLSSESQQSSVAISSSSISVAVSSQGQQSSAAVTAPMEVSVKVYTSNDEEIVQVDSPVYQPDGTVDLPFTAPEGGKKVYASRYFDEGVTLTSLAVEVMVPKEAAATGFNSAKVYVKSGDDFAWQAGNPTDLTPGNWVTLEFSVASALADVREIGVEFWGAARVNAEVAPAATGTVVKVADLIINDEEGVFNSRALGFSYPLDVMIYKPSTTYSDNRITLDSNGFATVDGSKITANLDGSADALIAAWSNTTNAWKEPSQIYDQVPLNLYASSAIIDIPQAAIDAGINRATVYYKQNVGGVWIAYESLNALNITEAGEYQLDYPDYLDEISEFGVKFSADNFTAGNFELTLKEFRFFFVDADSNGSNGSASSRSSVAQSSSVAVSSSLSSSSTSSSQVSMYVDGNGNSYPWCLLPESDDVLDGWGWENNQSCKVPDAAVSSSSEGGSSSSVTVNQPSNGFYIQNGALNDANGNPFIMRGVNVAHVWYQARTAGDLEVIAGYGANTVRIVLANGEQWTRTTAASLKSVIDKAKSLGMISVVEIHDSTGYPENGRAAHPDTALNYWLSDDIKSVLFGQEAYVIVNIANEPFGNGSTANMLWTSWHQSAVKKMRDAGYKHTLMVDAANWGQDWSNTMRNNAASVLSADPDANTMFSVHMYEVYGGDKSDSESSQYISDYIQSFIDKGLVLIVGEFADIHYVIDKDVNEQAIFEHTQSKGIGYIAWSWTGNDDPILDIWNLSGGGLTEWGKKLMENASGIPNTSVKASVF